MRTWSLAPFDQVCGFDPRHVIRRGEPRLVIDLDVQQPKSGTPMNAETMAARPTPRVRCVRCAGEAVPTDLPPLDQHGQVPWIPTPKRSAIEKRPLFALALDWKQKALGEREPGEDDA